MRDLLEATRCIEARGQFVGEGLVVDKAVCASRKDGSFVKVHGIERAAIDPGDLRPDEAARFSKLSGQAVAQTSSCLRARPEP